jgi:hypothetical protein
MGDAQMLIEEALSWRGVLSQSVGVLSHERASSVLDLDHQLQGHNLIFKKVTEVQFVVGQQTEFVRPVKLRDHLIGDV